MIKTSGWNLKRKILGAIIIGLLAGLILGIVAPAHAEEIQPGQVAVFVYDQDGNPVANASVMLITNTSQIAGQGLTDKDGKVVFSEMSNFTGTLKVEKDGFKDYTENITYSNDKGYVYVVHLESDSDYTDKAKEVYEQHKTAVLVGGGFIFLLLIGLVFGSGKRRRW